MVKSAIVRIHNRSSVVTSRFNIINRLTRYRLKRTGDNTGCHKQQKQLQIYVGTQWWEKQHGSGVSQIQRRYR
eukprot:m.64312 g.64312  ORF g.64312 m.64312 type:complete len:73 (-) comp23412_c0_seq1:30-248(-)